MMKKKEKSKLNSEQKSKFVDIQFKLEEIFDALSQPTVDPEAAKKDRAARTSTEFVILTEQLINYDVFKHVPSDISIDQKFLPPSSYKMQENLDDITKWTANNLMQINESKSNFIIFSRSKEDFTTRLSINDVKLDKLSVTKLLGVWLDCIWKTYMIMIKQEP